MSDPSPLLKALKAKPLRFTELAERLGVHKAQITRWAHGRVPSERVLDVEAETGVSRHELRPDIYGAAPTQALAS